MQLENLQLSAVHEGQPRKHWTLLTKRDHMARDQLKDTAEPLTEGTESSPPEQLRHWAPPAAPGSLLVQVLLCRAPGLPQSGHSCFQPGQQEPRASVEESRARPMCGKGSVLPFPTECGWSTRSERQHHRAPLGESPEQGLLSSQS